MTPRRAASLLAAALALAALPAPRPLAAAEVKAAGELALEGYAEWREGEALIVDGQRLRMDAGGAFKGQGLVRDFTSIPLGYEVKAVGRRAPDGTVLAREVEARPNGVALFEKQVLRLTDQAESRYRRAGRYFTTGRSSNVIGRLSESGPDVERVRRIVERVAPPYLDTGRVRVYVVDNDEWNAFAMGNFAIYVYSGLLRDMDDDEVAIVLGHELAHATHEHTRKRFTKAMWVQIAALGMTKASREVDDKKQRLLLNLITQLTAMAMVNGYGRDLEDQADRVGLRYAYQAGYDPLRGPALWRRFAGRYRDKGKVVNFFFGNHSLSSQRAADLEGEIGFNYRDAPRREAPAARGRPVVDGHPGTPGAAAAPRPEIREGMTPEEVRALLGPPQRERVFGSLTRWSYPEVTVLIRRGRVIEVRK